MPLSESLRAQAVRELMDTICAACNKEKKKNQSFCSRCYFSLTPDQRKALYTPLQSGYAEIYSEIRDQLKAER